jgi:phosphoacetylglucosamine mutase
MSALQWRELYMELPSKQVKLAVPDKSVLRCSADETRLVQPVELQVALDAATRRVAQGRCFVRPSGTEDVVRIYAEALTAAGVNQLVDEAISAIRAFFAGLSS